MAGCVRRFGVANGEETMMQSSVERVRESQTAARIGRRSRSPVFVLGCPRSGTTVLYHMLLSAGGFANYRSESNVFNILFPRFVGIGLESDRKRLMEGWVRRMLFRASGLDASGITVLVVADCRT